MYEYLDGMKQKAVEARKANPTATFETTLKARMEAFGGEEALPWIYRNDVERVWEGFLQEQDVPGATH